jgi:hypothetical protein
MTLEAVLRGLAEHPRAGGKLDLSEACVDDSHAGAQGRPSGWTTRCGKSSKIMAWQTAPAFLSPLRLPAVSKMKRSEALKRRRRASSGHITSVEVMYASPSG